MLRRYRDYIPLPLWADGDTGSPGHHRSKSPVDRRWRTWHALVALSVLANVYFLYETFTSWPSPLDNYQGL